MSNRNVFNLLRIASRLEATDPQLASSLERCALSVINPGAKKFEEHVGDVVEVLKNLKSELEKADKQLDVNDPLNDHTEFAKWCDEHIDPESEDLGLMLKVSAHILRMADDETAGVMDKVKGLFKKKKPADDEAKANEPSYQMDESEMDEFVEGKRDWSEPSQKIEKETRENKEFFEDAKNVQQLLKKVRDKPSRKMVRMIIQDLGDLIDRGMKLMKGKRNVEKAPQVDLSEEEPKKPGAPSKPDLKFNVQHYTDMLKEKEGDEKATIKVLKEFFNVMQPLLASRKVKRSDVLPLLVRTASANPGVRPVLLPIIKRWTGKR